jgi:hypothetical protein
MHDDSAGGNQDFDYDGVAWIGAVSRYGQILSF